MIFNCTARSICSGLLKDQATNVQTFYQDITRDVYSLRLRGAENLEEYHLERGMEEMKKLAEDKQNPPELQKRKSFIAIITNSFA